MGGALGQLVGGQFRVVHYKSKAFDETQRNWPIVEREAFALIFCLESLQDYFLGEPIHVFTDNKVLTYIHNATTPKLARWAARLSVFSADLHFVNGEENGLADWLSRLPHEAELERESLPIYTIALNESPKLPSREDFKAALETIAKADLPAGYFKNGLYYVLPSPLPFVPAPFRTAFLHYLHRQEWSGHMGINKCVKRASRLFT